MAAPVVLWDFDETLARRPGRWSGLLMEVLDELIPGHPATLEAVRRGLREGFPWHRPEEPHHHLGDPQIWWTSVRGLLARAVSGAGLAVDEAEAVAVAAAQRYRDPAVGWELFPDTVEALSRIQATGGRNAVLSNHIPELTDLVAGLGLEPLIEATFSSAVTGWEKPHPEAFRHAIRCLGEPPEVWMVGDNPRADVAGAEAIGIPAILVHGEAPHVARQAPDLLGAVEIVGSGA